jgi:FtsP/CotA-like multicopper oxidase with cupredoxin domain
VSDIGVQGAQGAIIAIDGNPIPPFALDTWRLGPAMRMDIALRTPQAGGRIALTDFFAAEPIILVTLAAQGSPKRADPFAPVALTTPQRAEPDLANAERHELKLSASAAATNYDIPTSIQLADGRRIDLLDSLCSSAQTLWAIDGKTWNHPVIAHGKLFVRNAEEAACYRLSEKPAAGAAE